MAVVSVVWPQLRIILYGDCSFLRLLRFIHKSLPSQFQVLSMIHFSQKVPEQYCEPIPEQREIQKVWREAIASQFPFAIEEKLRYFIPSLIVKAELSHDDEEEENEEWAMKVEECLNEMTSAFISST